MTDENKKSTPDEIEENVTVLKITGVNKNGGGNYNSLGNKPSINNVRLQGNKTAKELNLQESGEYASSRITNMELEEIFKDW